MCKPTSSPSAISVVKSSACLLDVPVLDQIIIIKKYHNDHRWWRSTSWKAAEQQWPPCTLSSLGSWEQSGHQYVSGDDGGGDFGACDAGDYGENDDNDDDDWDGDTFLFATPTADNDSGGDDYDGDEDEDDDDETL